MVNGDNEHFFFSVSLNQDTGKYFRVKKVHDSARYWYFSYSSVQSLSPVRLCDPMDHSTPGLPVHHQLLEFTQTYVH